MHLRDTRKLLQNSFGVRLLPLAAGCGGWANLEREPERQTGVGEVLHEERASFQPCFFM